MGADGTVFEGATQPPGGNHAEVMAIEQAGAASLAGATLYTTLEPCNHVGRTGPCTEAIIEAGIVCVVIGILDPDALVSGQGVARLREAGVDVDVGVQADAVALQLRSYVHHRLTGRPFVTLKLAATIDGRTAAPDGSSQWITGQLARADVHSLRAASDGILVGAGTVRDDDPALTVRDAPGDDPRRYVLGEAPVGARVHPCTELHGDVEAVLEHIGSDGIVDLLVEGGASVAASLHEAGLVDRYVIYLAAAVMGDGGRPLIAGRGAETINDIWRGKITDVTLLGNDVRLEMVPDG